MVEELAALRCDCHVNAAACLLKLKDFESAAAHCEDALAIKPDHKKALFRLGLAYEALWSFIGTTCPALFLRIPSNSFVFF